jgi:hypothetical protein
LAALDKAAKEFRANPNAWLEKIAPVPAKAE